MSYLLKQNEFTYLRFALFKHTLADILSFMLCWQNFQLAIGEHHQVNLSGLDNRSVNWLMAMGGKIFNYEDK